MTDNPLVSVIIPVFKVEQYLDRCVSRLVNQSYSKLEIILVNDGSPDNSPALCDAWAEKDNRIKVIHKANGGQADARNQGVAMASGDYIAFIDSDDYVAPDYIEYLLRIMAENDADIACSGFRMVYDDSELFENQPEEELFCADNVEACKEFLGNHYMEMVAPWGKIFPAHIVKQFPFPRGHRHEDEAIIYKLYYYGGKTVISNRQIYAYFQNSGSVTHNKTRKHYEDSLNALERQCEFFASVNESELSEIASKRMIIHLVTLGASGEEVSREYVKANPKPAFLKNVGAKYRLLYRCYALLGIDLNALALKLKNKK